MIRKIIYILIVFIICVKPCFALKGAVDYNSSQYAFKSNDEHAFLQKADENMDSYEKAASAEQKDYYLHEAMKYYFLLEKINKASIEAQIGLGRVYDELNQDKLSKKHFYTAYNMNKLNPKFNLYFADYYYKRNDLVRAFRYYDVAYKAGYAADYKLNYKMGILCEKLADIEDAKIFYRNALRLNSKLLELKNKLHSLENLNYSQSQYYLFNK